MVDSMTTMLAMLTRYGSDLSDLGASYALVRVGDRGQDIGYDAEKQGEPGVAGDLPEHDAGRRGTAAQRVAPADPPARLPCH